MRVLNKHIWALLAPAMLAMLAMLAAAGHAAAGRVKLTIQSSPQSPPVKVWIDNQAMGETPLAIPGVSEGRHQIRVSRQGGAFERTVLLKAGPEVILIANFLTNDFDVENRADLKYDPLQDKKTTVMITSNRLEPTPTQAMAPAANAPAPAAPSAPAAVPAPAVTPPAPAAASPVPAAAITAPAASPVKPLPGATASEAEEEQEGDTSATEAECEPGQWCAEPAEGEMGPPAPPEVLKNLELKKQEQERAMAQEQARQQAEAEQKPPAPAPAPSPAPAPAPAPAEPKKPAPPCVARPAAGCAAQGSDVRGTMNNYYCSLAHHDFERAYNLWSTTHDLAWFYNVSKSFCAVSDYRIEGFQAVTKDPDQAEATYVVTLLGPGGAAKESWSMRAILVKTGGQWKIRSVAGKPAH